MGLKDKAKRLARGRKREIDKGLDKAEQVVSEKTSGKHAQKVRSVRRKADEALADGDDKQPPPPPR